MKLINCKWLNREVFLLFAGLAVVPAVCSGDDSGGYFGAGIGRASLSDYCSDTGGLTVATCDDKDTAFKVFGGYRFTRNVAVEAAYVDLGKYRATGGAPAFDIETKVTGVTAQAVGIVPFGNEFSLMGRIGAIFWDLSTSGTVGGLPGRLSDNGVDLALGGGVQYKFARNFGVRADLDYYPNLGNENTGEDNVTAASIGVVFLF